jgi:tRNA dimethylallyltransferase
MIIAIICGATGIGKSDIAYNIAKANGFEIISADSRQIYKDMEIGTGQVEPEWKKRIPHHFMGFLHPSVTYSANQYRKDVMDFLQKKP